jgi:hypothetical protein
VNRHTTPYREDTDKKGQGRAFLAKGSASLEPDEDGPAIMAMATPTVGENDRTYKTPFK